jgi:hypothetical protein
MTTEAATPDTPTPSTTTPEPAKAKNDFEVAGEIHDVLKDIPTERQEKILRWVCESLDLKLAGKLSPTRTPTPAPDDDEDADEPAFPPSTATDIKSFVDEKKPRSDTQFAAVAAYYYRFRAPEGHRKDSLNAKGLQEAHRHARGGALHLPKATLNNAAKAGYLDRAERGEFRISTVGENLVAMTLPGKSEARTKPTVKRPRKIAKKR